jgi:hydrogenase expression/formation protein HypC
MCLAIPGQIKSFDDDDRHFATVEVASVRRRVNVELLEDDALGEGDWVLIHVGFAMSKISAEEAGEQLRMLRILGEDEAAMEEVRGYGLGEADL